MIDIDNWFTNPKGAMQLTEEEEAFVDKWEIGISTGYIGIVRCYWRRPSGGENVVFQTSVVDSIVAAMGACEIRKMRPRADWQAAFDTWARQEQGRRDDLVRQFKKWLHGLMPFTTCQVLTLLMGSRHSLFEEIS